MKYGLIGETLSHSYSNKIHALLAPYQYDLYSIAKEDFEAFIKSRTFDGLNVTIPYKNAVIPFLEKTDPLAKRIGAVNTVVKEEDGSLTGYNTDYYGFLYAADYESIRFEGKKVLVLGSGGTSRTVAAAVTDRGAKEVIIVSRSGRVNYENIYTHADAQIIVNTTPVGMYPRNGERLIDLCCFNNLTGVMDVIYNPLSTCLILDAQKLKIPCTGGFRMLAAQAKKAAELFTKKEIEESKIKSVLKALLKDSLNIVLVGMPGSGKSTVGKLLSQQTGKQFIDIDAEIEKLCKKSIPQIFENEGEDAFREIESSVISKFGKLKGLILSTGGGAVLKDENRDALKQNGFAVHLNRDIEKLELRGRPLSKGVDALKKMYINRIHIYTDMSDMTVDNNGEVKDTIQTILGGFYEKVSGH